MAYDPSVAIAWEVGWGTAAILVIGLWMNQRAENLEAEIARVTERASGPASLNRLSPAELHARRASLEALAGGYAVLAEPISWPRVLWHLSRAVPPGAAIERLQIVSPPLAPGAPAHLPRVRVTAPRDAGALAWLSAEPYLALTFPQAVATPAGPSVVVELSGGAAAGGGP